MAFTVRLLSVGFGPEERMRAGTRLTTICVFAVVPTARRNLRTHCEPRQIARYCYRYVFSTKVGLKVKLLHRKRRAF